MAMREAIDLDIAELQGQLNATNVALHAVIATHPSPKALSVAFAQFDDQLQRQEAARWLARQRDAHRRTAAAIAKTIATAASR